MADFQEQAMSLTGLTIDASSTVPSRAEFSTFLKDGVIDVTEKWLIGHPQDGDQFTRESAEATSNASLDLGGADIISVIREDGVTSNNWRPCRKISVAQQYIVTDTESLSFASKINPVYMIGDTGKISVFPAPGADPNAFKVYYINNSPVETGGSALDHASTGIEYFPGDKIHLVVLYASIKSLHSKMTSIISDLSSFSITPVPPNFADAYEDPSTDVPSSGHSGEDIEAEIAQMQDYIETNEDVELANAKASEIGLRFKRALDQFQSGLGKYSAEIQGYAQEVVAEVSEQGQKVQTETAKYQWLQDRAASLQAEYIAAFATPQPQGQGR